MDHKLSERNNTSGTILKAIFLKSLITPSSSWASRPCFYGYDCANEKKKGYEGFTAFKHHLKEQENKNINFSSLDKVVKAFGRAILKNEQEVCSNN